MTAAKKAAIKKILIDMERDRMRKFLLNERDFYITPYLERIVKIMEVKDEDKV